MLYVLRISQDYIKILRQILVNDNLFFKAKNERSCQILFLRKDSNGKLRIIQSKKIFRHMCQKHTLLRIKICTLQTLIALLFFIHPRIAHNDFSSFISLNVHCAFFSPHFFLLKGKLAAFISLARPLKRCISPAIHVRMQPGGGGVHAWLLWSE